MIDIIYTRMDKKELDLLIQQGEGYNLEFKEGINSDLGREICAFANANGGKILIGVSDNGSIKGVNEPNKVLSQIQDIARHLSPKFAVGTDLIDRVIVITIPEGTNKPYSSGSRFFMRYGSNTQQLERDEIRDFFEKEGLIFFDEKPNYDFDLKKDLDVYKFNNFLVKAKITPLIDNENMLNNLDLIKDKHLKNAGVLLFCHRVTKFFSHATISCILYQGKTKYEILDKKEYDADLNSNFENALLYIKSHLNTRFVIKGGPREEILELPEDALREVLLNAIAHRDYNKRTSISVEIFSDRVIITNPGGLVNGFDKKDFGKRSFSRNNLLFGLMQRMNLVERAGSGIARIRLAMKSDGLKTPKFDIDSNWFSVIFTRKKSGVGGKGEKFGDGSEKSSEKIISLLKENKQASAKDISENLGITSRAVEKQLAKLKKDKIIKRVGPAKGGHWEVMSLKQ